jgi:hypothetical protein
MEEPETKKSSLKLNADKLIGIMATIVSLCALSVSFYQVSIERKHQLASMWPSVSISTITNIASDSLQNTFAIRIDNKGIGPAIIKDVKIWYKGQLCKNESDLLKNILGNANPDNGETNQMWVDKVISAGESFNWIKVGGYSDTEQMINALRNHEVKIKIRFASVYEEEWDVNYHTGEPLIVKIK